jgi:UDP-N-acetylglucosamine--N-acetylmuramyl-(pentapeptide) pyrophosphoryl-undecaprenol N-acetylglucosamine transferase
MKVAITGGHHSSALPVIEKLREKNPDVEIFWIGHKYSAKGDKNTTLEYREIKALNIPFFDLKAGKVYKTYDLGRWTKIPLGFLQAFYYLLKIRPDVIMSFGGYLAAPVVLAGWFLRIPSLTHEQTVVAGYSNRFISKFVKKVLISWKESEKFFPKNKIKFVGIPLRDSIFQIKSDSFNGNENLPTVYVSGGKIGSHIINNVMRESLGSLLGFCNIILQCGDNSVFNDHDLIKNEYEKIKDLVPGKMFLRKFVFEEEIGEALLKSNLVISRSGAHTIAEMLALKKPCLLIPIPWVSHNEQFENALMLKKYGLGEVIEEKNLNPETLLQKVGDMLKNLSKYELNNAEVLDFLKESPSGLIADEIIQAKER